MRRSGILLHPSSLPGPQAVGSLGKAARQFIDFLVQAKQSIWQFLPIVPTDDGGSPYASTSAMAFNIRLIDLDELCSDHYAQILSPEDLADRPALKDPSRADFRQAREYNESKLALAYQRLCAGQKPKHAELRAAFEAFKLSAAYWLDDFVLFESLQQRLSPLWLDWPKPLRERQAQAIAEKRLELQQELDERAFAQFIFYQQWQSLRALAMSKGIQLMGDLPIFVSHNSVDVWAHRELFELNSAGKSEAVAGVPPDYFSPEGQLWGNPLYNWKALKARGYSWWLERFRALAQMVDIIRIDHFRGFEAFWSVPATDKTAKDGQWIKGPGMSFLSVVKESFPTLELVAEDLGILTPEVEELRLEAGFPGMRVLHFGFPLDNANDHHVPHMHSKDSLVYCGTHDNDTTLGWYRSLDEAHRDKIRRYLSIDGRDIVWQMMQTALASVADTAILSAQDLLELGSEARMNIPGLAEGNWDWRLSADLNPAIAQRLKALTELYGRAERER